MFCDLTTIFIEAWTWISWRFRNFIPDVTLAAPERWWCGALRFEWFWSNAVAGNWWNVVSLRWWCPEVWIRPAALHCGYCLCLVTIFVYSGDDTIKTQCPTNDAMNGFNPTKTHRDAVGLLQDDLELTWPLRTDRLEAEVRASLLKASKATNKAKTCTILHSPDILEKKYEGHQKSGFKNKPKYVLSEKNGRKNARNLYHLVLFFFS